MKKCTNLCIYRKIKEKSLSIMLANPFFMEKDKNRKHKAISKFSIKLEKKIQEKDIYHRINPLMNKLRREET